MPLLKLSEAKGINVDLVTDWEYSESPAHEAPAPTEEPTPGTPEGETADASSRAATGRRARQGAQPERPPEAATPAPAEERIPQATMTLHFVGGRSVSYTGIEAHRLYRYFSGMGRLA
jgi:hypothetical protein